MSNEKSKSGKARLTGLAVLFALLGAGLVWYFAGGLISKRVMSVVREPAPIALDDHVRGDGRGGVTIIVYTDFECSDCRALHERLTALSKRGTFRWVHRYFPLEKDAPTERMAVASECAARQGRFWEFVDAWYRGGAPKDDEGRVAHLAHTVGVDKEKIRVCMGDPEVLARVRRDRGDGDRIGVVGTPTYYISGRRFVGSRSEEQLAALLNLTL